MERSESGEVEPASGGNDDGLAELLAATEAVLARGLAVPPALVGDVRAAQGDVDHVPTQREHG